MLTILKLMQNQTEFRQKEKVGLCYVHGKRIIKNLIFYFVRIPSESAPNPTTGGSRLIFSVHFSYFLFIFYLPRCTLPDFPSASSLASSIFTLSSNKNITSLSKSSMFHRSKVAGLFQHFIHFLRTCNRQGRQYSPGSFLNITHELSLISLGY